MSLNKKIILSLLWSIFFIAILNIVGFYFAYSFYLKWYIDKKNLSKQEITIDYINKVIEKQTIDEVDNIFNDIELQLFEIIWKNNWKIPLDKQENIDIVINYLTKAWVTPKYIEELIPENYFEKIISNIKNKNSPEYAFYKNIVNLMLIVNIVWIFLLIIAIFLFSKIIISPIKQTAEKIRNLKLWKDFQVIKYEKADEIWLLVNAINGLNTKLNIQDNIRNRMLADISHELKTPITSIQCYLEWIKDEVIKLDDKTLNWILNEMQRLIKLVNLIMEYENFENWTLKLSLKEEDVKFITENVINQFRQKLKINNQKIITSWNDKKLLTDKDSYIQIVQNIIWNFIKYAWVWTTLKIDFWINYIKFSDNWKWIKKNEIPYITEKFYQWTNKKVWSIDDRWIWVWFSVINKIIENLNWDMEINSDEWKWFEIKIITKTSH